MSVIPRPPTRRNRRLAIAVACACVAVLVAVATTPRFSIVVGLFVILGVLVAGASNALNIHDSWRTHRAASNLLLPRLMRDDRLVDRDTEMSVLVDQMASSQVVNCYGQQGAGKSFLLSHLTDVINGHREAGVAHPKPKDLSAALYFDLADVAGFGDIEAQVCQATVGKADGSWDEFVAYAVRSFGRQRVVLILDNVNTPGLWQPLGEAAYRYLAARPDDKLVLGSIDAVVLRNVPGVVGAAVGGLDLDGVEELLAGWGVRLDEPQVSELHAEYDGLPKHVLLKAFELESLIGEPPAVVEPVSEEQLIPELLPEDRSLLAYASLFAVIRREISIADLEHYLLGNVEDQVDRLERRSLLTAVPARDRRRFKVHDIVRDAALRELDPEVSEAALVLFERAHGQQRTVDAALFALFAEPEEIGAARFDDLMETVIRSAVASRNYALLSNLHQRASQSSRVMRFLSMEPSREDLFHYGRASELAGLGQYTDAQDELISSSIGRTRVADLDERSWIHPEMRFLQADIAHLQNRYDEAADLFEELGTWAAKTRRRPLEARCVWGHAHVLRHQGRDLDEALRLFDHAIAIADAARELFAKSYSVTGATGIKVYTRAVPDDEEDVLAELEAQIAATSAHDGYMLEVWKSQAQVAWFRGKTERAFEIIEAAIARALLTNDRLLYNLYFERAEFRRLSGAFDVAVEDYQRTLQFGTGNGDRNLISNALLGLAAVDIAAGRWLHHDSSTDARASVLRARATALEADIHATAHVAGEITAMLDAEPPGSRQAPRLILF
jgi:tetratricopeptide (TPR) repeat protein